MMKTYEFTIVADGLSLDDEEWQDRFLDAGCDDALVAIQRGRFVIRFDRESSSFAKALRSAKESVEKAGAHVLRVEPDPLVSASDIADRAGLTRQVISLYANGSRGKDFPSPVVSLTSQRPLWNWSDVASWLADNDKLERDAVDEAKAIEAMNAELAPALSRALPQEQCALVPARSEYRTATPSMPRRRGGRPTFRTDVQSMKPRGVDFLHPPIAAMH
ncbi:hypothetical protein WJT74_06575 [Sphingomicrobium sp. XHP0239]|uniref:hypothetical protein n=1 Tax=Sphingomicrobium maritimum TaxID=3133972 RepID=UPI0031CC7341